MSGRNAIISHCRYRVDTKRRKGVCDIFHITCVYTAFVDQLDKYWLPNCDPLYQPRYARVENCYYNKVLKHYNDCIIVEFLDNNTSK